MLKVEYFHIFYQSDEILHIFVEPFIYICHSVTNQMSLLAGVTHLSFSFKVNNQVLSGRY